MMLAILFIVKKAQNDQNTHLNIDVPIYLDQTWLYYAVIV